MSGLKKGSCARCGKELWTKRASQKHCKECSRVTATSRAREKLEDKPITSVWSCGGGVDSTAIAVLITQGKLPVPDLAFMTDVGWERYSTWDHVTQVLRPRLQDVGCHLHVLKTSDYRASALVERGYVTIPAYRKDGDTVVKLHTRCSGPWKLTVAKKWLRQQGVERCENWIGIAEDESRRAKPSKVAWFGHRYPLIELGMTREDCLFVVGQAGWPMPPRTSCVMCPQQSDHEWRRMAKMEPEEFARACAIERTLWETNPDVFLHRSCVPLGQWAGGEEWNNGEVDANPRECNPFSQCVESSCPQKVETW